jgi:hypothetical protein
VAVAVTVTLYLGLCDTQHQLDRLGVDPRVRIVHIQRERELVPW